MCLRVCRRNDVREFLWPIFTENRANGRLMKPACLVAQRPGSTFGESWPLPPIIPTTHPEDLIQNAIFHLGILSYQN